MDGAQNPVYCPPEFVYVQTVLGKGKARHELKKEATAIDMLGQEFEPKRKKYYAKGRKEYLSRKKWQNFKGRNFKKILHRI